MSAVERSDLPVGQQSNGHDCDVCELATELAEERTLHQQTIRERDEARAEVARVRAQVAEEIARDMEDWSRRQFAQASATWNPQSKRDLESYGAAYGNAAYVARLHAGKPAESVVAALPDVVGAPALNVAAPRDEIPDEEFTAFNAAIAEARDLPEE